VHARSQAPSPTSGAPSSDRADQLSSPLPRPWTPPPIRTRGARRAGNGRAQPVAPALAAVAVAGPSTAVLMPRRSARLAVVANNGPAPPLDGPKTPLPKRRRGDQNSP
jgi:hypothetical protein